MAAVVLGFTACSPDVPAPSAPPRNIVLISLDTLRRDHVQAFNPSSPAATPNLNAIAEESIVFDNAWAQIPFTLPSHMSMFTGLYPDAHGVDRKKARLGDGVPTLSTLLAGAGYQNIAVVTNSWMKGVFGFDRGFDHYERLPSGLVYADRVTRRVAELLEELDDPDRPLFLLIHCIDPHSDFFREGHNALPYYAPPEFLEGMGISPTDRDFCDAEGRCATDFLIAADREPRPLAPESLNRIAALYARGIEYLDRQVGDLKDVLDAYGLWDNALIVVTSDHGEEFRDHGRLLHIQPYVENLAIPLMVRQPGAVGAGTRVATIVETVDYLPTLLDVADVAIPAYVQGTSLKPVLEGDSGGPRESFGRDKLDRRRYSLRNEDFTLIHHIETGLSELYERGPDPGETENVADLHPNEVAALEARLVEIVARNLELFRTVAATEAGQDLLSSEEAEQLRAIGYLE